MPGKIFIEYSGVIKRPHGKNEETIEISSPLSMEMLLNQLGYRPIHHKFILISVNGQQASLETIVKFDDKVFLFLPSGGG